jgi:chemotaxis protein MotA
MTVSDEHYHECCELINKLFSGLMVDSIREGRNYIILVNSALIGERLFHSLRPLFVKAAYKEDTTYIQFSFKNIPEHSPLLTKEGIIEAYCEIPRQFGRCIMAESHDTTEYEREHFNGIINTVATQLGRLSVNEIRELIQLDIERYQALFEQSDSFNEKNSILLKMNRLYSNTRNANKLQEFIEKRRPKLKDDSPSPKVEFPPTRTEAMLKANRPQPKASIEDPVRSSPRTRGFGFRVSYISLSSLLGIVIGFSLIIWFIPTSSVLFGYFFSPQDLLFVLGGVFACTMVSYHGLYIARAFKEIVFIFIPTHVSPSLLLRDVETLLLWSQKVRTHQKERRSIRQLEEQFLQHEDPDSVFTKAAIGYLLENYNSERLNAMLNNLVNTMFDRAQIQVRIIRTMGNSAPVLGIIGSLINLITVFASEPLEYHGILQALAAAFVPTLYGLILAFLIFHPAARKLEQKNEMRRFRNQLLSKGFVLLSENSNTLEIQDYLNSFLDPSRHFHVI